MKRISSRLTWVFKWIVPAYLLGLAAFLFVGSTVGRVPDPTIALIVLVVGVILQFFHWSFFSLIAYRVDDCGDHLRVRQKKADLLVPLADVAWIIAYPPGAPSTLRVHLKRACELGFDIDFLLPVRWWIAGPHPVVDSLNLRLNRINAGIKP